MKSASGSNKSKRKGGFPSLLSRAKGNPFSSRRIPTKQGQQGKLEPTVPKHPPAPVDKIKFTKASARGKNDDDDRDSSKMSSLSDHDDTFRRMRDSGQNPGPTTVMVATTPQKEVTKVKVQPAPAQATEVAVPAVVTAQVAANKSQMETITMNVNANGIVAVNKDKKDDSPSLPSSEGSSQFSYGKAFQGDNNYSPQQSATKTTGAVAVDLRDKSIQLFDNHLMFDKQALRPQQMQPPPKQQSQQKQQRPTAVAVAATTHHHLHQPFIPPKFEKVMPKTKAETQEKIMDLDKGHKVAPSSPITLDLVASNMARAQSQPQAAPPTNAQERPKMPVSLVKDRSKNPDSLLERSKTTVSLLEKSKMPLSLLQKSKNPGNLLGKSQTPFSLLERSKVPVSGLKGKSQTPVSIEETAALKSREQKQQPQQGGAEYTHLAIADAAVITEFMSVLAVKKGIPQDLLGESSPTVLGTPRKNYLVRKLVRKINASSDSSPIVPGTPNKNDLAHNMAFDKVRVLLNRLNPPHTANSEPPVAASDSTRENLPRAATASSTSTSSSELHIAATHSATFQENDVVATTSATHSTTSQQNDVVDTTSALEHRAIATTRTTEPHIVDGLTATSASALDQHAGGSAIDPTPLSPPKASERSGIETPQDAPTSPPVSRVPVDAPDYFCLTEMRVPELKDIAAVIQLPKAIAADETNTSKHFDPTKSSNTTKKEDDEKALESLKNDFKSATFMQEDLLNRIKFLKARESGAQFITSDKVAGRETQHRFLSDQNVIDVEDEVVVSAIFKASKSASVETKQRIDDSSETKQSIVDTLSIEDNSARCENNSVIPVGDLESKASKTPTPTRLMLSVKTNPYDDTSDEDIPAPVVDATAMMAALESTLPPRSAGNRKKSTSPRKRGKSSRKSKKQAGAANLPSPLTESNDMKETLKRKAEKKAEKHKSQHGQQKGVMTEAEARFLARQAMENATKSKLDCRDPPPGSDPDVHPLKEVVFSGDETVSDLDQSLQKFPVKNIVVEESSNVSLLDQSKKDMDITTNESDDEEMDRYAPLISPGKDDSVLDGKQRQVDESKRQSPRQALADSITEWSIEEVETEDTGEVAVEVMLNSCSQTPLGQRLVQRWFGQKSVFAMGAVKAQSTAAETKGRDKEEKDTPEDFLSDPLMPYAFKRACGGLEHKIPAVLSQKSTVKLPDTTPIASNARKPNHFFAHDTSEEEDSVNDELLEQGNVTKPKKLREPLGREPIPSMDLQSHLSIAPKEPDGQLLYQSGEDPSVAGSGQRSSVPMNEQEAQSCLGLYHAASDIDRYRAMEETPTAKSRYDPKEPPAIARKPPILLGQIQEQERDDQIVGEQDTSLVKKIVEFGHNMMCLSPSSQNDVKNAMRVLGPSSLVLLERSIHKAEQGKKDNFTDVISQDPSRESKHSIEVSMNEDNEEIEVGPLATEPAGDACPSDSRLLEESTHVLSPTSQDLLKSSIREADEKKKLDSLRDGPSYESKHTTDEDSVDGAAEKAVVEALIKDVTEGLLLGSSKLESTNENGVGGAILEPQSQNDELFEILKADSSRSKQEMVKGSMESKVSKPDGHGVADTNEVTTKTQQERPAHSKLELIDLTGVDSADDVDDGVWLFDLSPKNDLTDGFLQSNSEDSLKEFVAARQGSDNKTLHLKSALLQSQSDLDSLQKTDAAQQGSDDKTNRTVNDTPNLLMSSLEDIIEYASKLLESSNGDQDKAAMESSLVVVQGIDVSFGEITEVNGLEVANVENKAIDSGITKLVEPTAVNLDHTDEQIVKPTQAKTGDLIQADSYQMKAIDLTDIEPLETIDLTDMVSVNSVEAIGLTGTKPARRKPLDLAERSLSNSQSEDTKSIGTQKTAETSDSQKPKVMNTESSVETNKDTDTHPSGKRLAEAADCERSVKEGQAESKNDASDLKEERQVEVTEEKVETEDERNIVVKDCDRDERVGLTIGASEDKTSEKSEFQVDATELCEDETKEKTSVEATKVRELATEEKESELQVDATELREDETKEKISVDATKVRELATKEKVSAVVTTKKRDILDFFFESTERFFCGPSQHDAILRDGGESLSQCEGDDGAQGSLASSSDSKSSALIQSAIPLDRSPELQPCELTDDPVDGSAEERGTGDVSIDEKDRDDQRAEATNAGETSVDNEDASIPKNDDTSLSNVKEESFEKGLLDFLIEDGEGFDEDGSIPKNDDTSPPNANEELFQTGLLDFLDKDGDDFDEKAFLAKKLFENENGSRRNNALMAEDDSSVKQDLSKRRKAPAPEDRLPQRFTREELKQKKAPAPEDRPSMELREANSEASRAMGQSAAIDKTPNNDEHKVEQFPEGLVDSESSQDSIYTSGSKTPSVVSECNTSKAPRNSNAFAPKPEIAPTRRFQPKELRRAPTPENLPLEMNATRTSHKDASDISEILGHFIGDATAGQIQSSARALKVVDVEGQSIEEKSERQRSTRGEEAIVCSSSLGDERGGRSGASREDVVEDWLSSTPSYTCEEEAAGVDWSTIGGESREDQYGVQSSISEEVDSRSRGKSSKRMAPTGEKDAKIALALMNKTSKQGALTGKASTAALALIAQASQSNNEELSIRSSTSENALTAIAAAAALALTAQASQASNEEESIRSSTSEEEVVDILSRLTVREAESTTDWEGMEVVEVRGRSAVSESDAVLEVPAEKTENHLILARANSNSSVDTPQMAVDKESSTALCKNEGLWFDFPCIGQHAEIDQQAGQYAEIDQQATNDESRGTSEGGTDDESRVADGKPFSLALSSLATRANGESRGITEGETVGESLYDEKALFLALGSMDTQATEIDPKAAVEVSHAEGRSVDESSVLHEERLVETQNLCWVPWPTKSPGNDINEANATESTKSQIQETVGSEPPIEATATRDDKYGELQGNDNVCWLPWGSTEKIEANSAGCDETKSSTEHGYSKPDNHLEAPNTSWLPWSQTKLITSGDVEPNLVEQNVFSSNKANKRDNDDDDEAETDGSAAAIIAAAAAAVVVGGAAKKLMKTEADKEEPSHAEESASLESHEINPNTANKSIDREEQVDTSAAATIVAVKGAAASLGLAAAAEISNKSSEDAYTKKVASRKTKSTAPASSKASVQSKEKSATSVVSEAKSTAGLKAKSLVASAKTKSTPSPNAKSTPSSSKASSKAKTTASSKAKSTDSLPSKEVLKGASVIGAAVGAAELTKDSSDSIPRRRWSGSLVKSSRSQSRIQIRSPQGIAMDKSKTDAISLRSSSSRSTSRNSRASIPQEISITKEETEALSSTASTTSSMNAADPGTASSASSISASQRSRDIKSTPATQEHFLAPLAIAAQRSKQEGKQARTPNGASSLVSTADVVKHESQLNISRFGSTSGEEPLDAPPPRASASVSSKQQSDFSPTSGRREEAKFSRFGSISGDESVHASPAHSFSSEAAMQNSLASPGSEKNRTSPRGSTFFSRIEEGKEEIESQSDCTPSVDETSLLLALTRSEADDQVSSPTSEEKVDTAVQYDASRAAAALDAAAAVVVDETPRSGRTSKRSILQRMRATSLVSGIRSKANSLAGVSKKTSRVERERELLSTAESSSLGETGERSNLGNTSSAESVTESVTDSEKLRARKAFLRAPRLQTVLDRLRTRKRDGDSESVTSSNAGPVEISELFTRYDSIVKHMVVFDESRLQSQTPTLIDVTDISTQRSPSPAPTNDGSLGSPTTTDGRTFLQITDLTDRQSPSPHTIYGSSTTFSDDKGSENGTMTVEECRLMKSSSSSESTTETTTPSQKARNLRQQLDQALHTSTMIRDTQERLGAELNTFKTRLEQQRRNGSPQRYGSPQRSIVSGPPATESISTLTNSTAVDTKADTKEPSNATIDLTLVPSSSLSFQSRIDRVEEKRGKALSRRKAIEQTRIKDRASPTFDQAASAFDRLKSGRNQNESLKTSGEDAIAVRKIAESAGKALLDEDNGSFSDDEDEHYADDDRIKKATVHGEFVDDDVQLQNLESIIENLRDAEERKREVTSRRIEEAKRSVTGSSASVGLSTVTGSLPVMSIEFDNEFMETN